MAQYQICSQDKLQYWRVSCSTITLPLTTPGNYHHFLFILTIPTPDYVKRCSLRSLQSRSRANTESLSILRGQRHPVGQRKPQWLDLLNPMPKSHNMKQSRYKPPDLITADTSWRRDVSVLLQLSPPRPHLFNML